MIPAARWLVAVPFEGLWMAGIVDSREGLFILLGWGTNRETQWVPVTDGPGPDLFDDATTAYEAAADAEWSF